jgi:hypothetical protein
MGGREGTARTRSDLPLPARRGIALPPDRGDARDISGFGSGVAGPVTRQIGARRWRFAVTDPNQPRNVSHLRDDQLLLHASGELHELSAELVSAHIRSCPQCKARLNELEGTLIELVEHMPVDAALPSAAGPRALLKAQLAGLSDQDLSDREHAKQWRYKHIGLAALNWRSGMLLASLALIVLLFADKSQHTNTSTLAVSSLSDEPNAQFTPGAVVAATQRDVCSGSADASATIPPAIKSRVLQLYGVASVQGDAYEVDYLITPELGGATDIRNLWPEPYEHTMWNAHVKDQLENRLHELVCHGELDLTTAQHDISTDWIAAYRKYFHANVPVGSS